MRAAKLMQVPPWELAIRPDRAYWQAWALTADAAEAEGQKMAHDLGSE